MSNALNNPIIKIMASVKLTLILLVIFAFACGIATFIESESGTETARAQVYNARWFEVLLGLLALNLVFALTRLRNVWPRKVGYLLVHVAMIVILLGAGMTRFLGYEGSMHIREGASANTILSRDDYVALRVGDEQAAFKTRLYKHGQTLSRKLDIGGTAYRVSVDNFWPHYEEKWVESEGGQPLLKLSTNVSGNNVPVVLKAHGEAQAGNVQLWYLDAKMLNTFTIEPRGSLSIRVGQEQKDLVVADKIPVETELGGFVFTIFEFRADFKVGQEPEPAELMTNPMIRVRITAPDGSRDERMLFAYHPDFDMQHGRSGKTFADVEVVYQFARKIFLTDDDGGIVARSSLPLLQSRMETAAAGEPITPGTPFRVSERLLYRTPGGDFSFVLQEALSSAVVEPGLSDNRDAPAAARIRVAVDGEEGEAVVVKDARSEETIEVAGNTIDLSLGRREIIVPYRLHLEDFVLKTYPGSDKPAGYESHVLLFDDEEGVSGEPVRIYMNHPLTHRGFKHFQSSYDRDERGTILTVNYDPGKIPTYIGYTLLTLGFIFVLIKDFLLPQKSKRRLAKETS